MVYVIAIFPTIFAFILNKFMLILIIALIFLCENKIKSNEINKICVNISFFAYRFFFCSIFFPSMM